MPSCPSRWSRCCAIRTKIRSSTCWSHSWCAPVYARMRGIRRIIENPMGHGKFDLAGRRKLARTLKSEGYTHAFVLPNSWKSALVPYLARIPKRVGYLGEARYGLLTDARRLDRKAMPRLVDRFAALAVAARRPGADAAVAGAGARCHQSRGGDARAAPEDRPSGGHPVPGRRVRRGQALAAQPVRRTGGDCSCATACRCGSSVRPTTRSPPTPF